MRIIANVRTNSGPCFHRIIAPLLLMPNVDVYITNNLLEEHFEKGCDIFIYNRTIPNHALPTLRSLQLKYGFKICLDIDDHWELDPHHILFEEYQTSEYAKEQTEQIAAADFVTTTHDRMATAVSEFNCNVHILPNAIPKKGQFNIERKPHHLTRLFWQGTITHQQDIALLQRPNSCLNDIAGKIQMIMAGYVEEQIWHKMFLDYTTRGKHQYKLIPATGIEEYYAGYAEADICLIPLLNSSFNRHKSNLKVLEAANLGLPCVVSDVHPYKDMPVMYARNSTDWVKWVRKLVGSRHRQKDEGLKLAEFCEQHFNFDKINRERKQVFSHYANKVTA